MAQPATRPAFTPTPEEALALHGIQLGAHFARLQMEVFFTEFLDRLPPVELDGPVQRLTSNFINGVNNLPLRWAPA